MSIIKNIKQNSNNDLSDIFSLLSHVKNNSNNFPFNISNKNSLRSTLERINNKNKKNSHTKKSKNKSKDSEMMINNYLSQRPRLNTEGNDNNLMKMKFSMDFFNNKIDKLFQMTNNKSSTDKRVKSQNNNQNNNENNFRKSKRNNLENNKLKKLENINILNKKNNTNFHFTRIIGNNANSCNKKKIENTSNNEYNNTNTQNFSHTQSYFKQTKKNNKYIVQSENFRHRNNNKSEDIKKRGISNNKIVKENKAKNFSGLLLQMSPPNPTSNKLTHIQNYFKNIHKNKKLISNQKGQQYNKEKKNLATEPKEMNNENKLNTEDFFLKNNSNYLVVSKNPTQITNIIEKKENNKYINNYFNICESINMKSKNNGKNKNSNKSHESDDDEYDTFEEIHFYFIQKIQKGKKLKSNMNNKKS